LRLAALARVLSDSQFVDSLQGRSADAADQGLAVTADERVGDRAGARGAVELGGFALVWLRHLGYFTAAIEVTRMILVLSFSVPVTVTFLATYQEAAFWSLSA